MADKHAYTNSPGALTKVLSQFRKSFPASVTADTLKKLGFAKNNESYVINVLRFLKLIQEDGSRTDVAHTVFTTHDDPAFATAFSALVQDAYGDLFELRGEESWTLDRPQLISYFRSADKTTEAVGKLQARTFQLLAALSGHGEIPTPPAPKASGVAPKKAAQKKKQTPKSATPKKAPPLVAPPISDSSAGNTVGLTVRIEINLPADGDQETYDQIFKSIRENLIDG